MAIKKRYVRVSSEVASVSRTSQNNRKNGYYSFEKNDELQKSCIDAEIVKIVKLRSRKGDEYNKIHILRKGESVYNCFSIFGNPNRILLNERELTKEEIAKLTFGLCTRNGEIVADTFKDTMTGKLVRIARPYCNISNIV